MFRPQFHVRNTSRIALSNTSEGAKSGWAPFSEFAPGLEVNFQSQLSASKVYSSLLTSELIFQNNIVLLVTSTSTTFHPSKPS